MRLSYLQSYGKDFGLEEFHYASFQRCISFKSQLSAADVVHAVSALLESRPASKSSPTEKAAALDKPEGDEDGDWQKSFWTAYDGLLGKSDK